MVQRYAADNGYQLVGEYVDEGFSGDKDTLKRSGFVRMTADVRQNPAFEAVLCENQDRFGRWDSLEAGHWVYPFRQAKVSVVTMDKGKIDWDGFAGRVMYGLLQEGKNQYLIDLSARVSSGQLEAAKKGSRIGRRPYGYRNTGEKGHKQLVLEEDEAVIVRRIFHEFVVNGRARTNIARRLTCDGIKSPGGEDKWHPDAVTVILKNPTYIGRNVFNQCSRSKYSHMENGKVVPGGKSGRNNEVDWIVHENCHEPIIDMDTFGKAQAKLALGQTGRSNKYATPEVNPYIFTGKLRCGRCGAMLHGVDKTELRYRCKGHRHGECTGGTNIREDKIFSVIADYIESQLEGTEALGAAAYFGALKESDMPKGFAWVRDMIFPPGKPVKDLKALQRRIEKLRAQIAKTEGQLYLYEPENLPLVQESLRKERKQLADLEAEHKEHKPISEQEINTIVVDVLNQLYGLANACRMLERNSTDKKYRRVGGGIGRDGNLTEEGRRLLRRFLQMVDRIDIVTATEGAGNRTRHTVKSGEIHLRSAGITTGNLNRHLLG